MCVGGVCVGGEWRGGRESSRNENMHPQTLAMASRLSKLSIEQGLSDSRDTLVSRKISST